MDGEPQMWGEPREKASRPGRRTYPNGEPSLMENRLGWRAPIKLIGRLSGLVIVLVRVRAQAPVAKQCPYCLAMKEAFCPVLPEGWRERCVSVVEALDSGTEEALAQFERWLEELKEKEPGFYRQAQKSVTEYFQRLLAPSPS